MVSDNIEVETNRRSYKYEWKINNENEIILKIE